MAPATAVAMTATEAAELAHEAATKAHQAVSSKLEFFAGQRNSLAQDCERLRAEYDAACRSAAQGDGSDPAPIAAELAAKQAKLHGTQLLYDEGVAKAEPLARAAAKAGLQLTWQKESDVLSGLLKEELQAKSDAQAAFVKSDEAARAHGAVVFKIGECRKRVASVEKELREASNG